MKNFDSPQILHAIRYCGRMSKNALCLGCYLIVVMVTPIFLLVAKNLIFNSETVVKSAKCVALFLKSIKTLQPNTWSRYNTIILVYIYVYCSLLYQNCAAYIEFWPFELMAKIWLSFLWISPKVYQFQS